MRRIDFNIVIDAADGISNDQCEQIVASFVDNGIAAVSIEPCRIAPGVIIIRARGAEFSPEDSIVKRMNTIYQEFAFLDFVYYNNLQSVRTTETTGRKVEEWLKGRKFVRAAIPIAPVDVIETAWDLCSYDFNMKFVDAIRGGELKTFGGVARELHKKLQGSTEMFENLQCDLEYTINRT